MASPGGAPEHTGSPSPAPEKQRATQSVLSDDFFSSLRAAPSQSVRNLNVSRTQLPSLSASRSRQARVARSRPSASPSTLTRNKPASQGKGIRRMSAECAKSVRIGQAILDAAAVVKELVENALDAGATRIDVRLEGKAATEKISVADNGTGIAAGDHDCLCLPHATSKLAHFSDLEDVTTYGFRGEAMSAIAALAETVSVVTRTTSEDVGYGIVYSHDGTVQSHTRAARNIGTTVQVEMLFARLPVRRQDAVKHSARDISRCLAVVQSYAIIASNVRFELRVGSDTRLITHPKAGSPRDEAMLSAIVSVLGRSQASSLMPCSKEFLLDGTRGTPRMGLPRGEATDRSCRESARGSRFSLRGYVSKPARSGSASGGGRTTSASQFYFLNSRPVDMPRLARAVNECFRRCAVNMYATPTCILALEADHGSYDVNVSPDKRQVMIQAEGELIAAIQKYLESLWSPQESRPIPLNQVSDANEAEASASLNPYLAEVPAGSIATDAFSRAGEDEARLALCGKAASEPERDKGAMEYVSRADPCSAGVNAQVLFSTAAEGELSVGDLPPTSGHTDARDKLASMAGRVESRTLPSILDYVRPLSTSGTRGRTNDHVMNAEVAPVGTCPNVATVTDPAVKLGQEGSGVGRARARARVAIRGNVEHRAVPSKGDVRTTSAQHVPVADVSRGVGNEAEVQISGRMRFSFQDIVRERRSRKRREIGLHEDPEDDRAANSKRRKHSDDFSCTVQNSADASLESFAPESDIDRRRAEQELIRVFRQEWFRELKIVGQFNLGFIICLLHDKDLFIIDQHASDEKYNYEDLERKTIIDTQRLLKPLALDLAVEDELLVLEYSKRFQAGGFDIEHRPWKQPTQRMYLRSQPSSKSTMFVIDDLRQIISSLKDPLNVESRGNGPLRPARVRAMFASRACRKSVMIGTALSVRQMRNIVQQLASLTHPWSCPHGRPTMRHLADLNACSEAL